MSGLDKYRKKVSAQKRRGILAAAHRVFQGEGFDGGTMAEIAKLADVSTATLYKHFDSKEELFCAVVEGLPIDAQREWLLLSAIEPLWRVTRQSYQLSNQLTWLLKLANNLPEELPTESTEEAEAVA